MAEHEEHGEGHGGKSHGHGGHGGGGHAEGEHEGAPEWLISFADNVMLQMGFFVILLALNMGPKATKQQEGEPSDREQETTVTDEWLDAVIAIREGFNRPVDMRSTDPNDQPLIRRIIEREGGEGRPDRVTGRNPETQSLRPSEYTTIGAAVPFEDSSADLSASSRAVIAETAQKLKDKRWVVEVRGHTSPSESFRRPDEGYSLSYQRSLAVARVLVEQGVRWEQLRLVACADGERLTGRVYTREADRSNQRVEVVMTQTPLPPSPFTRESGRAGEGAPASGGTPPADSGHGHE